MTTLIASIAQPTPGFYAGCAAFVAWALILNWLLSRGVKVD